MYLRSPQLPDRTQAGLLQRALNHYMRSADEAGAETTGAHRRHCHFWPSSIEREYAEIRSNSPSVLLTDSIVVRLCRCLRGALPRHMGRSEVQNPMETELLEHHRFVTRYSESREGVSIKKVSLRS